MTKDSTRPRRVAELIKRELAMLIARELDDPIAHRITLTGAEASPDLCSVRVYFSLLAGSAEAGAAARVLNRAAGGLRHALRRRVSLKRGVPQLRFVFDESLERGARVDALIERAIADSATAPGQGPERRAEASGACDTSRDRGAAHEAQRPRAPGTAGGGDSPRAEAEESRQR